MDTLAPATAAPDWSTTVPLMVPVVDNWALHSGLASNSQSIIEQTAMKLLKAVLTVVVRVDSPWFIIP
jgi:hypothetical protein